VDYSKEQSRDVLIHRNGLVLRQGDDVIALKEQMIHHASKDRQLTEPGIEELLPDYSYYSRSLSSEQQSLKRQSRFQHECGVFSEKFTAIHPVNIKAEVLVPDVVSGIVDRLKGKATLTVQTRNNPKCCIVPE
jgi:hypothetical protein